MSNTDTITAPPKPKAKPSAGDKQAVAHVEKWMKAIREINDDAKS